MYGKYKMSIWLRSSSGADRCMILQYIDLLCKMMGLDHVLDQFMWNGIRWYLALGFRDMQIPVTQVPSFPLASQTRLHREVVEEERNVCVFVVSSARGSASKAKLRWAEVGILEGLLPTFIPWKSKPKCQVLPSDLARESQSKGNRRQKTPFKQVRLSYQGGRGREEQAVPTCFLFTSVLLTCWQTPPV